LFPIAGLAAAELNRKGRNQGSPTNGVKDEDADVNLHPFKLLAERHHPCVVELIANEAGVKPADLVDFEMVLYDTQGACIGGINDELIFSARLDNLGMSFCSTMALIGSLSSSAALDDEPSIRLVSLFDHEEIGSQTAQGADSNLLSTVIRRLSVLPSSSEADSDSSYDKVSSADSDAATSYEQTLSSSFLISADMAHSVHPNYPAKYESDHRPEMNKGTVIKINANARYATNSPGIVLLQEIARRAQCHSVGTGESSLSSKGVPLQFFVVRNDSSCGSTIGPMLSAALGTRTLDLGNPQLSMHSIRETSGVYDVEYGIRLFESFFKHFSELERKVQVD
ncbi:MAG: hypothetical protein M1835_003641, partial [Candelina submexicana]